MLIKTLALSALVLATCVTSKAVVVVDNLTTNGSAFATTGDTVGQSFTTGSTAVSLVDVVFPQMSGTRSGGYTYGFLAGETLSLYGNAAGNVPNLSTPIFTFSVASNTLTPGTFTAGPSFANTTADASTSPISLAANSRYWLVLSSGNTATSTYWSAPDVNNGYTERDALGLALAQDAHSAYKTVGGGAPTYFSYASGPQLIYIDAVPEPSSICLLGVAGVGALLLARRARATKVA